MALCSCLSNKLILDLSCMLYSYTLWLWQSRSISSKLLDVLVAFEYGQLQRFHFTLHDEHPSLHHFQYDKTVVGRWAALYECGAMTISWFAASRHRLALALLLASRLILKRAASEAADVETCASETRRVRGGVHHSAIISAIFSHVVFARKGAQALGALVRKQPEHFCRCIVTGLKKAQAVLEKLDKEDSMKLTDLSKTGECLQVERLW